MCRKLQQGDSQGERAGACGLDKNSHQLLLANTVFRFSMCYRTTWAGKVKDSSTIRTRNIYNRIDHVVVPPHCKPIINKARTYPGTEVFSYCTTYVFSIHFAVLLTTRVCPYLYGKRSFVRSTDFNRIPRKRSCIWTITTTIVTPSFLVQIQQSKGLRGSKTPNCPMQQWLKRCRTNEISHAVFRHLTLAKYNSWSNSSPFWVGGIPFCVLFEQLNTL